MGEGINPFYTITHQTKAIMYKNSAYYRSKILEGESERYAVHKPEEIIHNNLLIYGCSLECRKTTVKNILNSSNKLPMPIAPEKGLYMIPTASTKNKDCVYVAFHQIKFFEQRDNKLFIGFHDGSGIYVNTSVSAFDLQWKRMCQVIVYLNQEILFGRSDYL